MPFNVLVPSSRGTAASRAPATVQRHGAVSRKPAGANAANARAEETARLATVLREQVDGLLVGLRMDVDWLDQCLAEQAGRSGDAARTMRLEMRIRCDGMGDQIDRVLESLDRMVAEMQPGMGDPGRQSVG